MGKKAKAKEERRGYLRGCLLTLATAFVIIAVIVAFMASFGGFGTGPSANADEFAQYAASVSDIEVPEGTRVVALGEATHGNREFQELKLEVFRILVERYGVRAFALEADFGGCTEVNRYIHGGEGTVEEAVANLVFTLYRTDQMAELISWMRTYNETAAPGEDLCFYGFDMQSYEYSYRALLDELHRLDLDASDLETLWDGDDFVEGVDVDRVSATLTETRPWLEGLADEKDVALALQLVDCLQQNIELGKVIDSPDSYGARDSYMAQNVRWILGQEEARGNGCIFVSAHNGHIDQAGSYGPDSPVMGHLLADELGEAYYAIGTDFFRAEVNLPSEDGRMTHTFYSYDPLAKAAATCGYETCWLDFSAVPSDSSLARYVDGPISMGSVGEGFSPFMYVLPQTYRVKREPSSPYDSMIFVPYATPTQITVVS